MTCPISADLLIACLLLLIATSPVRPQSVVIGPLSDGSECCSQQLVDSATGRVVIETSRTLPANIYSFLRMRLCTTDPLAVQLWRRIDASNYEFRWQLLVTPTLAQTSGSYVTISLPNAVNITADDRIGVYSSSWKQLSVPFDSSNAASVVYSLNSAQDATFAIGQRIQLDNLLWPRTFSHRLGFCKSQDCAEMAADIPVSTTVSPAASCCQVEATLGCDPSADVTDGLATTTQTLRQMQQNIDKLNKILNTMVSQKYVTGLCPQGFLSGAYGVGSCYLLFQTPRSMAEALLTCRDYSAALLTIETAVEDQFIRNFVQNNTVAGSSVTKFWTAGMYYQPDRSWVWFMGTMSLTISQPNSGAMQYTNWQNSAVPTPTGSDDVCMTLNVDGMQSTNYWTKDFCARKYYYICEVPKRCL